MTHLTKAQLLAAGCAASLLIAGTSGAFPLDRLDGQGLESIYGSYAPDGDCAREPRLTIGDDGFTFEANGRTEQPPIVEHAASFMGPDYDGIAKVFFPFPVDDGNMGPLLLIVNDGEEPGLVRIDPDLAPGQQADPFDAAFTAASPLMLCAETALGE